MMKVVVCNIIYYITYAMYQVYYNTLMFPLSCVDFCYILFCAMFCSLCFLIN